MVQPILASTLLHLDRAGQNRAEERHLPSNFVDIDDVFHGGFKRGRITCISGERRTGKTLIALHILVTCIISSQTSQAAIIDTTGTFDVLRLYKIITSHVKTKQTEQRAAATSNANSGLFSTRGVADDINIIANQSLDRVKIMRVFDFVGVSEAINEIREDVRSHDKDSHIAAAWAAEPAQKTHVADSQTEEGDDDIMLFDGANEHESKKGKRLEPVSLVLVDNITSVINPILKTDYVQGQYLLTTFMRSLSFFAKDTGLTAILLNNAASTQREAHPSFPGLANLNHSANLPASTYIADPMSTPGMNLLDQPSIFTSTTARPSLGKTFASLVDCHVLLSMVPKRRKDAEVFVGGKTGKAEAVYVMEVLGERYTDGVGRWAAFEIADAGTELKTPS